MSTRDTLICALSVTFDSCRLYVLVSVPVDAPVAVRGKPPLRVRERFNEQRIGVELQLPKLDFNASNGFIPVLKRLGVIGLFDREVPSFDRQPGRHVAAEFDTELIHRTTWLFDTLQKYTIHGRNAQPIHTVIRLHVRV